MTINFSIEVVALGIIISQGFFAAILLLLNRTNTKANLFLGLLVLCFSLWLCDSFFGLSEIYRQDPNYYFLPIYYSLAFGPLVYFFTKALVEKEFQFTTINYWHFLPVLLQALLYVFLRLGTYKDRRWFWMEIHEPYTYDLEFNLTLISLVIYLALSVRLVRNYQHWIKNEYSEISQINLRWLYQLFIGMIVLSVLWLGEAFLRTFYDYFPDTLIIAIPMGVLVLFMAIGGIQQKTIIGVTNLDIPKKAKETQDFDQRLLDRITKKMTDERFYLDAELTLQRFAEGIGENKRAVSESINFGLGIPFIDFVNQQRIAAFKQLLTQENAAKFSLLGLAFESGFNSKSTFNRVFKSMEGISPSEYRKRVVTS